MCVSLALLLISTIHNTGFVAPGLTIVWLASMAVLSVVNIGAALGTYVASVALFAVLRFNGWGSVFNRPDNYALLILIGALIVRVAVLHSSRSPYRTGAIIAAFLAYGLMQSAWVGALTRSTFAWYMRMFGLPMLMFFLIQRSRFALRDFHLLARALLILGAYMAFISILQYIGWWHLIVPPWVAEPSLASVDPSLSSSVFTVRAGGILMQPEWNALALSLIFCLAIGSANVFDRRCRWFCSATAVLCLIGVFLSYTRAAWLACALASLALLLGLPAARAAKHVRLFAAVATSVVCGVFLVLAPDTTARQRLEDAGTVDYRLGLWQAAISMAAARPLMGSGFATFGKTLSELQPPTAPTHLEGDPSAHNTLLSVLVELGTLGLILYVVAVFGIVAAARETALAFWHRGGSLWVTTFAVAYVLQVQFVIAHEPTTNQIFFGVLGAIAGLQAHAHPDDFPQSHRRPTALNCN
jgi:O-antigen ligase